MHVQVAVLQVAVLYFCVFSTRLLDGWYDTCVLEGRLTARRRCHCKGWRGLLSPCSKCPQLPPRHR